MVSSMQNFKEHTLVDKGRTIQRRYLPLKFKNKQPNALVKKAGTPEEKMKAVLHSLFNTRTINATSFATGYRRNVIHCPSRRGRSYYDAYRLCMHYCPEVTFSQMYNFLKERADKAHTAWMKAQGLEGYRGYQSRAFWTCPNIGRARFCNQYKINFK